MTIMIGPLPVGPIVSGGAFNVDTLPISGIVVAVLLEPSVGCLSGLEVTIKTKSNLQTVIADATPSEGPYYPHTIAHLNTSGAVIADYYSRGVPVDEPLNIALSSGETGDIVNVTLITE